MKTIKTKEQARQYGIDYQKMVSDKNLSYGDIVKYQFKLFKLAEKFHLVAEFKENGLI